MISRKIQQILLLTEYFISDTFYLTNVIYTEFGANDRRDSVKRIQKENAKLPFFVEKPFLAHSWRVHTGWREDKSTKLLSRWGKWVKV